MNNQLLIYSVFTMNLLLQCALGIRGVAVSKTYGRYITLIKLVSVFCSIIITWILFSKIISAVISGFGFYALIFPVSYMVYEGLEFIIFDLLLKKINLKKEESFIDFPGAITAAAVFICMIIAAGLGEVVILSLGFILGILFVCLIIKEVRRRAALESVPQFLRGKPLVIITLGLVSLIFSAASLMILNLIGVR